MTAAIGLSSVRSPLPLQIEVEPIVARALPPTESMAKPYSLRAEFGDSADRDAERVRRLLLDNAMELGLVGVVALPSFT